MVIQIVGTVNSEEDAKEIQFMAKLILIGIRAQELSRQQRQIDNLIDETINMYQPKGGEK